MKYTLILIALFVAQIVLGQEKQVSSIDNSASPKNIEAGIDAIFNLAYPAHLPGATVLIAKDDNIIYRKAFGMADLELNVQLKPESVMQLASITKQFTSTAVLILMEQGKLSLHDPISKFIEDYPRGNKITLHHLLNHTSGIKDYTRIPELRTRTALDLSPEELISTFKDLPLEFNPNEKQEYSNSGYVLLGYIIEKLSGMSYGDFIHKNIFDKLGMKNSEYLDAYKIIPNRASGYQITQEGNYENADYMSPTFPYAAGALMSSVDDMFLWNKAIHHNTLISQKSKQIAFTNNSLIDGKLHNYGYGWYINELAGITSLEHTGGINGFSTSGIYMPEINIYAIVLTNRNDRKGPESYNLEAVSIVLGKPLQDKVAVNLSEKQLKKWVGAYQFDDVTRFITYDNGALYSMREAGRPVKLIPLSENEFKFDNSPLATYNFSLKDNKKQVIYAERIEKSMGTETDKKLPTERVAITLPQETLIKYVGVYELQPSFQIEISMQNAQLLAVATGRPPVQLFAETVNSFFIKEMNAQIIFTIETDGAIKSLTFSQGGNKMKGNKIK